MVAQRFAKSVGQEVFGQLRYILNILVFCGLAFPDFFFKFVLIAPAEIGRPHVTDDFKLVGVLQVTNPLKRQVSKGTSKPKVTS